MLCLAVIQARAADSAPAGDTQAPAAAIGPELEPAPSVARPAAEPVEPAAVNAVEENRNAPGFRVHKVWLWQESRDCLWNIAKKYYNDPWQWKKIYLANKKQISDPRKIYPRQILIIPPADEPVK